MQADPRLAVFSDAHANLEAMNSVFQDMDGLGITRAVCLGDAIGYGPEPEATAKAILDWKREGRDIPMTLGNHEKGVADRMAKAWFNPFSRKDLERTKTMLSPRTVVRLAKLPAVVLQDGMRFVHGAPPDSPTRYLFEMDEDDFRKVWAQFPERLCFAGHTHELMLYSMDGDGEVERTALGRGRTPLDPDKRHIVNVGSVGQPRDGNNNAKYVLYDQRDESIEVRFVEYDIQKTVDRIMELKLPKVFADRLW